MCTPYTRKVLHFRFDRALIDTLMRTALEQAGAERGILILSRAGGERIAAQATTGGDTVHVQLGDSPVSAAQLPESVLYHVLRTRESVILDDAAAQLPFCTDAYIRQHRARSLLCLPLMNQARLTGALFLENNLTPHVFTPTRIALLRLVVSQAAIALENARLYRDLAEREAKIRRLVDANIIGIVVWNFDGDIVEANDAFLRMVGYDRDDLNAGRVRWTDLTPPEWGERSEQALFLRAERLDDGRRTFRVLPGEPMPTSYGHDLYSRIFAETNVSSATDAGTALA